MKNTFSKPMEQISSELEKWKSLDIVFSYFHPQLGQILINPKSIDSLKLVDKFKENELVVAFVGNYKSKVESEFANKALVALKKFMNEEKVTNLQNFYEEPKVVVSEPVQVKVEKTEEKKVISQQQPVVKPVATQPQATQTQQQSTAKKKLSPQYGVLVANELFHNGNVEAWKKIIASYQAKYNDTKILVFYEGEEIKDINTLFKWGKVKHGTNIYVSLLGPEFRDVSKLRRYLSQGASNRFEDFLRGDPTKILSLF